MSDARKDAYQVALVNGWTHRMESPHSFWSETFTGPTKRINVRWVNGKLTALTIQYLTHLQTNTVTTGKLAALKDALSV
jgi:hypothetical protein